MAERYWGSRRWPDGVSKPLGNVLEKHPDAALQRPHGAGRGTVSHVGHVGPPRAAGGLAEVAKPRGEALLPMLPLQVVYASVQLAHSCDNKACRCSYREARGRCQSSARGAIAHADAPSRCNAENRRTTLCRPSFNRRQYSFFKCLLNSPRLPCSRTTSRSAGR